MKWMAKAERDDFYKKLRCVSVWYVCTACVFQCVYARVCRGMQGIGVEMR